MERYLIIFYLFGSIQGFFLSGCLFVKRGKPGKIFALIVFLISFDLLAEYLYWSNGWYDQWKMYVTGEVSLSAYQTVLVGRQVINYLFGPLIYLYTCVLTNHSGSRKLIIIHFVPAILVALIFMASCCEPVYLSIDLFYMYDDRMVPRFVSLLGAVFLVQISVYLGASLMVIRNYRSWILRFYSNTRDISLTWLVAFIVIAFGVMGLTGIGMYFDHHRSVYAYLFSTASFIMLSLSVYCVGFLALVRPKIFAKIHEPDMGEESAGISRAGEGESSVPKYRKNHLPDEKKKEYLTAIQSCMETQRPYLDPDLTLGVFSAMTGIQTHHISQVINDLLGNNFFHFVNHYRVQYARELLADPAQGESIISVCFHAGFNSKSVFNSVFKKHTGVTPSSFRKSCIEKYAHENDPSRNKDSSFPE